MTISTRTINANAETITTGPTFREAFKHPLCPIALKDGEPFALAGLWERWKDPKAGEELLTFTVITTDPNEVVQPLHDRMPVIVPEKDYARWLGDPADRPPADLLRPFDPDRMMAWPVDKAVGNVRNDRPELVAHNR